MNEIHYNHEMRLEYNGKNRYTKRKANSYDHLSMIVDRQGNHKLL